eukprot:gene4559-5580_t
MTRRSTSTTTSFVSLVFTCILRKYAVNGYEFGTTGFHVSLETIPTVLEAGKAAELHFSVQDYRGDPIPLNDLKVYHARRLHVVLIGQDLDTFGHVHPEDFGNLNETTDLLGIYTVSYIFPNAGRYAIALDFVVEANNGPKDMVFVSKYLSLEVPGKSSMKAPDLEVFPEMTAVGMPEEDANKVTHAMSISELQESTHGSRYTIKVTANEGAAVFRGDCVRFDIFIKDAKT